MVLETEQPRHHRVAIPAHHSLRLGTLNAILRSVARAKQIDKDHMLRHL